MFSLTFKKLNKSINEKLLFNISELIIDSGKCYFLSGINGSGKSTLLKIMAGLEKPDNIEIYIQNKKFDWKKASNQTHKEIIYLHQTPLMFDTSVKNNIQYGMRKQGFSKKTIQEKTTKALQWADLEHIKNNNARRLSGGEKQRVALARAYVLSPKILLLDEAFANVDVDGKNRIFKQIYKLKEEGIGIVITSHELPHNTSLADYHLQLKNKTLKEISDNTTHCFEPSSLKLVNA